MMTLTVLEKVKLMLSMLVPMSFFMMLEFYNFYTFYTFFYVLRFFATVFFNFVAMATDQINKFKSHFERAFNFLSHDITHVPDTRSKKK